MVFTVQNVAFALFFVTLTGTGQALSIPSQVNGGSACEEVHQKFLDIALTDDYAIFGLQYVYKGPSYIDCDNSTEQYTATICEDRFGQVKCPDGTTISVDTVHYGRSGTLMCFAADLAETHCGAYNNSKEPSYVENKCDGQQSCELFPTSKVFDDTCKFPTYKYLTVTYQCVPTGASAAAA